VGFCNGGGDHARWRADSSGPRRNGHRRPGLDGDRGHALGPNWLGPKITSPSNWQFSAGVYSVFTLTASGSPTPTLRVSGTPPFLYAHITPWGAVAFYGDPPANEAGKAYTVEVTASNGVEPNASQQLVMMAGTTRTTTSVSASPSAAVAGQPVTYTAKVAPVPNGGTVTVRANGATVPGCINIPVNTATGAANCSSTWLTGGTYDVLTDYSGFRLFLPSYAPGTFRLVVNPRPPAYWLATTNGRVFGLGTAPSLGHANTSTARAIAGTADGGRRTADGGRVLRGQGRGRHFHVW
jgi:Bacterial Ig-like domain (group 3)